MQIKLYNTSSEKNRLSKVLTGEVNVTGYLSEDTDLLNPAITVGYNTSLLSKNYCFIADFGRYYFITGFTIINQEIVIFLHVDVLMTYKDYIKNSKARIVRSASNFDEYIIDDMIINESRTRTYQRRIGAGFSKANNYLMLIGG